VVSVATASVQPTARPVGTLPMFQLFQLSIYWFGINAIWGGLNNVILQRRMDDLVGKANAGSGLALLTLLGAVVAILVQPTIGTISDYTITRWGRRKPYIVIGAVLDVVFLAGIATSSCSRSRRTSRRAPSRDMCPTSSPPRRSDSRAASWA